MSVVTIEQLNARYNADPERISWFAGLSALVDRAEGKERRIWSDPPNPIIYTEERAQKALDLIKTSWAQHRLGKADRPWVLVDLTQDLDKSQPWVGMEFETGFKDADTYALAVEELWNNHRNNTMDSEGYGSYFAELTFPPQNLADFNAESYNIDRLLRDNNELFMPYERSHGTWGMHVNFSTPKLRGDLSYTDNIATVLTASAYEMSASDKEAVFGRQPYGYFEARNDAAGNSSWLEGKLFETTTDFEQWQHYKRVINNLIRVVQRIDEMEKLKYRVISNFAELLLASEGEFDDIEMVFGGPAYWPDFYDDDYYDSDDEDY